MSAVSNMWVKCLSHFQRPNGVSLQNSIVCLVIKPSKHLIYLTTGYTCIIQQYIDVSVVVAFGQKIYLSVITNIKLVDNQQVWVLCLQCYQVVCGFWFAAGGNNPPPLRQILFRKFKPYSTICTGN